MITYEGKICPLPAKGYIAVVVSKFNRTVTQGLLDGALAKFKQHQIPKQSVRVCWVPGAYELPLIAKQFTGDGDCLAVVCLGAVIKGETSHDHYINSAISSELCRLSVMAAKPIVFGVLTCDTVEQAVARSSTKSQSRDKTVNPSAGNKGAEAAEVALEMIDLMTELPDTMSPIEAIGGILESFARNRELDYYGEDDDEDEEEEEEEEEEED